MDFGVVHAKIDEIGYITHAENLGYSPCWVTDSQMSRSTCWAVLGYPPPRRQYRVIEDFADRVMARL